MAKEAWDAVQPTTIKSCWDHTGIQHDLIMLHIPARHESGHGINKASLEAWNILEDLAMSQKTLPEAEESLKKVYGSTYQDSMWQPALVAITGLETMDNALDELAKFKVKFKVAEIGVVKEADRQAELVETNLMDAVTERKAH